MRTALRTFIFGPLFTVICLASEASLSLIPVKKEYQRQIAEILQTRTAKIAELTRGYILHLVEAAAGTTNATAQAAIRKEHEGITGGLLAPGKQPGLPADTEAAHRLYFGGVSQAALDFENAKKKIRDAYLKKLTTIAAKNKKDTTLGKEIAAERRSVLRDE